MMVYSKTLLAVFSLITVLTLTDFDASFQVFSGNDTTEIAQLPPGERRRVRRRTRRRTRRRVERRAENHTFQMQNASGNWYWTA